jgi:hypothetical protein
MEEPQSGNNAQFYENSIEIVNDLHFRLPFRTKVRDSAKR